MLLVVVMKLTHVFNQTVAVQTILANRINSLLILVCSDVFVYNNDNNSINKLKYYLPYLLRN